MADQKFDIVDEGEFAEIQAKAARMNEVLVDKGDHFAQEKIVQAAERKLYFDQAFHPPMRRVKVIMAEINGQRFLCPVLIAIPVDRENYRCVLLVAEEPRLITSATLVPRIELNRSPETDVPW